MSQPNGKFSAILADPPWLFETYSKKGKGRSAEAWYDCMPVELIKKLPVAELALPDCMLFVFRRANLTPEPGDRRPKLTP